MFASLRRAGTAAARVPGRRSKSSKPRRSPGGEAPLYPALPKGDPLCSVLWQGPRPEEEQGLPAPNSRRDTRYVAEMRRYTRQMRTIRRGCAAPPSSSSPRRRRRPTEPPQVQGADGRAGGGAGAEGRRA